jgi:hypothetical protein
VRFIERIRGPINKKEQKQLIAANMRHKLEEITESLMGQGKFVVFFSESSEFIFGDGFYHNIPMDGKQCSCEPDLRILVPLILNLTVLYVRSMAYMVEPKLMTRLASRDFVILVNETVQIYSKEYLFYRSKKPTLSEHFFTKDHLIFSYNDPIDQLIDSIPGVG